MSTAAPYNRDLVTAALMGFTAGYTTANTKVRFNTFGGMMTGNTVKVGISLQQKEWGWAGVYMTCILLFALGTVFALFMIQRLGTNAQRAFLLIFMAAFLLVDGAALALKAEDPIYSSLVSSLAAFALGAQHRLDPEPEHQPRPSRQPSPSLTLTTQPSPSALPNPCPHQARGLTPALTCTSSPSCPTGAQNLLSQKSGLIKGNTTFMTGNIQKMAEVSPPRTSTRPRPPTLGLALSLRLYLALTLTRSVSLLLSLSLPRASALALPRLSLRPPPPQALWNLATKKGGLKPAEQVRVNHS